MAPTGVLLEPDDAAVDVGAGTWSEIATLFMGWMLALDVVDVVAESGGTMGFVAGSGNRVAIPV
jgi:hypothetical protein